MLAYFAKLFKNHAITAIHHCLKWSTRARAFAMFYIITAECVIHKNYIKYIWNFSETLLVKF